MEPQIESLNDIPLQSDDPEEQEWLDKHMPWVEYRFEMTIGLPNGGWDKWSLVDIIPADRQQRGDEQYIVQANQERFVFDLIKKMWAEYGSVAGVTLGRLHVFKTRLDEPYPRFDARAPRGWHQSL